MVWVLPREQFHFMTLEDIAEDQQQAMDGVHRFLQLPPHRYEDLRPLHTAAYDSIAPEARAQLTEYFRPHNERLYELLGIDFGWEQAAKEPVTVPDPSPQPVRER